MNPYTDWATEAIERYLNASQPTQSNPAERMAWFERENRALAAAELERRRAPRQRFPLGECVVTPAAREHLAAAGVAEGDLLARHVSGDWGDLDPEDARENEFSVWRGFRLLSNYVVAGEKVWLITEADRSRTTLLMAREY